MWDLQAQIQEAQVEEAQIQIRPRYSLNIYLQDIHIYEYL